MIGRYCMLFDDQDWDRLAELWTDDSTFVIRDIAPPVIDLAEDGLTATARTDVVWISGNFQNTIVARCHDDLVHHDGRWRFRRRLEVPMRRDDR